MATVSVLFSVAMLACSNSAGTASSVLHLLGLASKSSSNKLNLRSILKEHEIVPDIIPKAPQHVCQVKYGKAVINFGNNLTEAEIEEKPSLVKWESSKGDLYTLLMIGPDVPTRRQPCEMMWRHWAVGNIPKNDIHKGQTLVEYENIEPFYRGGFHRIIFLIYKQQEPQRLKFKAKLVEKGAKWEKRGVWYMDKFIEKYNLTELVAINFFFLYNLNPHPELSTVNPLY